MQINLPAASCSVSKISPPLTEEELVEPCSKLQGISSLAMKGGE